LAAVILYLTGVILNLTAVRSRMTQVFFKLTAVRFNMTTRHPQADRGQVKDDSSFLQVDGGHPQVDQESSSG
jgi:hypothetical protein